MAFTAKSLASGEVSTTTAAIYTATGPTVIRSLNFFNTHATGQVLNLYITRSGQTRRQLYRSSSTAQYASISYLSGGESLILSNGDTLDADTNTASALVYVIGGATDA